MPLNLLQYCYTAYVGEMMRPCCRSSSSQIVFLLANEHLGAKAQLSSVAIKNALFHYHFGGCHSLGQGINDLD